MRTRQLTGPQGRFSFDSGLSDIRALELLIAGPLLRLLQAELPKYGMATKPSAAEPAALMVVGVASVLCGSDSRADSELVDHWPRLHQAFRENGYRVPEHPLTTGAFRYYRDEVLGGSMPESLAAMLRAAFAHLAIQLGLLPESEEPWLEPAVGQIVAADGTWQKAASEVTCVEDSRTAFPGNREDRIRRSRILEDTSALYSSVGYNTLVFSVRGDETRLRVILDVRNSRQSEMGDVVPALQDLVALVGTERLRCFVYDGAMTGEVHREIRTSCGVLTVNKPKGIRSAGQWQRHRESLVSPDASGFQLPGILSQCAKVFNVAGGLIWDLERSSGRFVRRRVVEVREVSRHALGARGFSWSVCLRVRCSDHHHDIQLDPNAELVGRTARWQFEGTGAPRRTRIIKMPEVFRILGMNESDGFKAVYGRRNDTEAINRQLKTDLRMGHRAGSYTLGRALFDFWLAAILANSKVWEEHRPGGSHGS